MLVQENAAHAVRNMLVDFSKEQGLGEVGTVATQDQMDDGSIIRLAVTIDRSKQTALFDFEGQLAYRPAAMCQSKPRVAARQQEHAGCHAQPLLYLPAIHVLCPLWAQQLTPEY